MADRVYTSGRLAHVCQVRNGGDLLLLPSSCYPAPPNPRLQSLAANICDCFVFDFHSGAVSLAARMRVREQVAGIEVGTHRWWGYVHWGSSGALELELSMNDFFFFVAAPLCASSCCCRSCAATIIVISRANKLVNNKYFSVKYCQQNASCGLAGPTSCGTSLLFSRFLLPQSVSVSGGYVDLRSRPSHIANDLRFRPCVHTEQSLCVCRGKLVAHIYKIRKALDL